MDIKNINIPNFEHDLKGNDYFCYAAYLKPGYHQLLIYDPKLEKVFCKDFIVNINQKEDIFPEFPDKEGVPQPKRIANVWRNWVEDTKEQMF